jgi:hypothetical protein
LFIIDRLEGQWAVIEYERKTFNIPKNLLPDDAQEGDVITIDISLNKEATEVKKKKIQGLMEDLFS